MKTKSNGLNKHEVSEERPLRSVAKKRRLPEQIDFGAGFHTDNRARFVTRHDIRLIVGMMSFTLVTISTMLHFESTAGSAWQVTCPFTKPSAVGALSSSWFGFGLYSQRTYYFSGGVATTGTESLVATPKEIPPSAKGDHLQIANTG